MNMQRWTSRRHPFFKRPRFTIHMRVNTMTATTLHNQTIVTPFGSEIAETTLRDGSFLKARLRMLIVLRYCPSHRNIVTSSCAVGLMCCGRARWGMDGWNVMLVMELEHPTHFNQIPRLSLACQHSANKIRHNSGLPLSSQRQNQNTCLTWRRSVVGLIASMPVKILRTIFAFVQARRIRNI